MQTLLICFFGFFFLTPNYFHLLIFILQQVSLSSFDFHANTTNEPSRVSAGVQHKCSTAAPNIGSLSPMFVVSTASGLDFSAVCRRKKASKERNPYFFFFFFHFYKIALKPYHYISFLSPVKSYYNWPEMSALHTHDNFLQELQKWLIAKPIKNIKENPIW